MRGAKSWERLFHNSQSLQSGQREVCVGDVFRNIEEAHCPGDTWLDHLLEEVGDPEDDTPKDVDLGSPGSTEDPCTD